MTTTTGHAPPRAALSVFMAGTAFLASLAMLALAPTAGATSYVDSFIGDAAGNTGGLFNQPRGIAVSSAGDLYVVDGANNRIQQFDSDNNFIRAFGQDVIVNSGTPANDNGTGYEVCDTSTVPANVPSECKAGIGSVSTGGAMNSPHGISINQQTGHLYVTDGDFLRVQEFDSEGNFIRTFGQDVIVNSGSPPNSTGTGYEICDTTAGNVPSDCKQGAPGATGGAFGAGFEGHPSVFPATAPNGGNLVVADTGNRRVQEFTATGAFVRAFGWDTASGGTSGFEVCTAAASCKAGLAGTGLGQFPSQSNSNPRRLAADPTGAIYTVEQTDSQDGRRVQKFAPQTAPPMLSPSLFADEIAGVSAPAPSFLQFSPVSAAVHPADGRVFVVKAMEPEATTCRNGSHSVLFEHRIFEFEADGTLLDTHLVCAGIANSSIDASPGIAVDPTTGRIYMSFGSNVSQRVYVLDEDGVQPAASIDLDPPSGIGAHSATLQGEVIPNGPAGFTTSYRFEVSRDGSTWTGVGAFQNIGGGFEPVAVEAQAEGLEANALYEVRIVTYKSFENALVPSATETFSTPAAPPEVRTAYPRSRTDTTAKLAASINANNSATQYRFEWGTNTTYGNTVPIPDGELSGGQPQAVVQEIDGLEPNTTYHYRIVAENPEGSVEGEDVSFTTRGTVPPQGTRAYEMVTPPFKVMRATGHPRGRPGENANPSVSSLEGETVSWNVSFLPLSDDVAEPLSGDKRIIRRTSAGWINQTRNTRTLHDSAPGVPSPSPSFLTKSFIDASSGDFETVTWIVKDNEATGAGLLPAEGKYANRAYTRRDGTGTNGFTGWLTNPEEQIADQGFPVAGGSVSGKDQITLAGEDTAILNDRGTAMARWGHYRGLGDDPGVAGDEDPSDDQQLTGLTGGATVYVQRSGSPEQLPTAPKEVVNECTGTVADENATQIPMRVGSGAVTDTIQMQPCEEGKVTSKRGAIVGGGGGVHGPASGPAATALADDGNRTFFQSPDPGATAAPGGGSPDPSISACSSATIFANTACPPQLFVRQYDSEGEPMVRWISRSRSVPLGGGIYGGAMIASQRAAEMGSGVAFQGASRDGSVVYFKTNAPLTPDDPNGGVSITEGSAQNDSFDLYRYELPQDRNQDPEAGTLLRVSGGPSGSADPNTNIPGNSDATVRFHSDDGKRAYFLTTTPIAGADTTPPQGGGTSPGSSGIRNLYLFDATQTGEDRWKFIGELPYASGEDLNSCATSAATVNDHLLSHERVFPAPGNCFRGTPEGSAVLFATAGQLTDDDNDTAADIYLYDAEADELVRLSAPPPGASPYVCYRVRQSVVEFSCNGELGRNTGDGFFSQPIGDWDVSRGWGGMRYYNLSQDENGVVSAYFATKLSLIPEDTNGSHMDVYEWRAGKLSLISPGNESFDAWFAGNSLDGEDVFFNTMQRIDPREIDDADLDVYDARIGGGFPYTPPPVPCDVLAFGCESDAIAPAPVRVGGTIGGGSAGNVSAARARQSCAKAKLRRGKRCFSKAALARKRCRKAQGKARARCVRKQVRKLTKAQKRQQRRAAKLDPRRSR